MKKKIVLGVLLLPILPYAQVGINTNSPTQMLDVNGDTRVRNLTGATFSDYTLYPSSSIVTSADGTLLNANALNILYSSGIFTWANSDNNWTNIRTTDKESKLSFIGSISSTNSPSINFSIMYKPGDLIMVLQNPFVSAGSASITNITLNGFRLSIVNSGTTDIFDITLSTSSGMTSINAIPSGNSSITGTWHSLPNFN